MKQLLCVLILLVGCRERHLSFNDSSTIVTKKYKIPHQIYDSPFILENGGIEMMQSQDQGIKPMVVIQLSKSGVGVDTSYSFYGDTLKITSCTK